MAYTNSKLVVYTKLSPNHSGQRTHSIDRISPHCVVGQVTAESLGSIFAKSSKRASSNYGIDKDGRIGLYVEEKNRSWCTSSNANDQRAVTIECASDTSSPYRMNDEVYETLIKLCTDICRRNGKRKLLWFGDKEKTLNYSPASDEMVITVHRWFANKSCIPVDSEVLTRNGWVSLHDIQIGDEIACADLENLRVTFEEVYDKVPERDQDTYTNNGFTATKDHRCVYRCQSQTQFRIEDYKHLLSTGQLIYIPVAGYMKNEGMDISNEELCLMVAVQADGHYMHEPRTEGDPKIGLEFHLKKERKVNRIRKLLEMCGYEYQENYKADGSVSIRVWGKEIVDDCEKYLTDKCFDWSWIFMSKHQAEVFLNEILFWDGCADANIYTSKQKINLDVVSAVAAVNGVGSNISGLNIQFRQNPYITLGREKESTKRNTKQHGTVKTRVSCVSVKTGIFLVRQNGKTFITGNCPGDWLYSRLGDLAKKVTAQLEGTAVLGLSIGDRGDEVEEMQKMLIACGYSCGDCGADGIFGNDTLKALLVFKKGAGMAPDGVFDEEAEKVLKGLYELRRSPKSGMKASELKNLSNEEVIRKVGPLFTADQKKSGVLASVSLAQFILESGYGKSELAQKANNCFGMKKSLSGNSWPGSVWDGKSIYTKSTKEQRSWGTETVTAEFRRYSCIEDSIADHSAYLTGARKGSALRYEGLKGCTDYRKAAQIIKNGGYATSTTYVDKLCSIIEEWHLTQYDAGSMPEEEKKEEAEPVSKVPYLVRVGKRIDIKKNAAASSATVRKCPVGIYTIVEERSGYGRLKSGAGWVKLSEIKKI